MNVGHATSQPIEKRVGSADLLEAVGWNTRAKKERGGAQENEPMTVIDDATLKDIARSKRLWDVVSRPEYASGDDGLGALMAEATLYYAIKGKTFVDAAYALGNFRQAKLWARDVRRARMAAREIPAGKTPLEEYRYSYRRYINYRRKYRRGGEILARKLTSVRGTGGDRKNEMRYQKM